LLHEGQDPDGLAALVAFHLHRLGIPAGNLAQADIGRDLARQLRRGALSLSAKDVVHIATALQLEPSELCRPLTDDEKREWHFYRVSARQVTSVWRRVAEACTAHNFSQRKLSELLAFSESTISRALRGERKTPVLNWHQAASIASALELPEGADTFISGLFPEEIVRDS
jgi:hypothetical protein